MKQIPYIRRTGKHTELIVDEKPMLLLGGEFHNSEGSDPEWMESHVWPAVRAIGGNCYLTPVYWESLEPEEGNYNYALVDAVISQARKENVRLCLLWFGLWKNGHSSYIPAWMKTDSSYFYLASKHHVFQESVSPFCEKAVEKDRAAFVKLMQHLKETDTEQTVVMIQVENEVGIWGGETRDYGAAAEEAFHRNIPEALSQRFQVTGSWEDAFGGRADECFMASAYASAVEKIASAGKEIYPLPMFMNSVPDKTGFARDAGDYPSGGPVAGALDIWHTLAPSIDFYGPDIYSPNYREITDSYIGKGPLVVPETSGDKDCVSKALFTAAAYDTILFSPFGIEELGCPLPENDSLSAVNMDHGFQTPGAVDNLREGYRCLTVLYPEILKAKDEGRIFAFLEQGNLGEKFQTGSTYITVTYKRSSYIPGKPPVFGAPGNPNAPIGGGFIICDGDSYTICAVSCNIDISPAYNEAAQTFVLDKAEYRIRDGKLERGRTFNGDQRNYLSFGQTPSIQKISFYRR